MRPTFHLLWHIVLFIKKREIGEKRSGRIRVGNRVSIGVRKRVIEVLPYGEETIILLRAGKLNAVRTFARERVLYEGDDTGIHGSLSELWCVSTWRKEREGERGVRGGEGGKGREGIFAK